MPLESPSAYNMYLFNLWIANHILIKNKEVYCYLCQCSGLIQVDQVTVKDG